jgi:pimeloyl-ACP methyl ester carboxylesterase
MADLLLIHGSCHGAWCWRDTVPALARAGITARAIDLPGHGDDPTPRDQVTLDHYALAICEAAGPGPVAVLGHSMAGYAIAAAACRAPHLFSRLIFLCAYLPVSGMSLAQMRVAGPRQPLLPAILRSADRVTFSFDPDQIGALFYHDCPPGTVAYAAAHLTPQPVLPQETPLTLTDGFAALEKHYIQCSDDRAIPPEYQTTMAAGLPPACRSSLASSHSPFFSMPDQLAARVAAILRA